jgi:transaldolase
MQQARLFLDTADIDRLKEAVSTGIVHGIATNPEKVAKTGKSYGEVVASIRRFFSGPISVQGMGRSAEEIVRHALALHGIDDGLAIKIPCTIEGIKAIRELVPQGVKTNCTLMFSPTQGLAAGLAGSPFVSPFVGRSESAGYDGIDLIRRIRQIYDAWDLPSLIIAASIKSARQVTESIIAGAHAVAVTWPIFEEMINHPLTECGYSGFEKVFTTIPKD